jgi:hypothetical protein
MTHSGGKPHAVGDRGQRYEVSFYDPEAGKRRVMGWSNTLDGARSFMDAIDAHPVWTDPRVRDREADEDVGSSGQV